MKEIVILGTGFEYSMGVSDEKKLYHKYFLPKNRKTELRNFVDDTGVYSPEVIIATDFEGQTKENFGSELLYPTSMELEFCDVLQKKNETVIRLIHRKKMIEVLLHFEVFEDSDVLIRYTEVRNIGDSELVLNHISSFSLSNFPYDGKISELQLHTYHSAWAMEGEETVASLPELNFGENTRSCFSVDNNSAYSTKSYFPYFVLEDTTSGLFYGASVLSPSQWRMEIGNGGYEHSDRVVFQGGMTDYSHSFWYRRLRKNESYITPKAVLTVAEHNINQIYRQFKDYQKSHLLQRSVTDAALPVIYNDWQAMLGDTSEEKIKAQLEPLQKVGVEVYVTDAGWYTPPGSDFSEYVGFWEMNRKRFPKGMRAISETIRSYGMIAGIWCEIEMAGKHSPFYNDKEALLTDHGVPIESFSRRFLDFSKQKVRDYADSIVQMFYDNGFRYLKLDYNADCAPGCDGEQSPAENLYQKRRCYAGWLQEKIEKYPDLMIEHCASGGMKLDMDNLSRASLASVTDQENYLYTGSVLCNVSRFVLPEMCGNWSRIPSGADGETIEFILSNSMMGRMCISGVFSEYNAEQIEVISAAVGFYKKYRFIIQTAQVCYPTERYRIFDETAVRSMDYISADGQYEMIYVSGCSFDSFELCPQIADGTLIECYPNQNGVAYREGRVEIIGRTGKPTAKIIVLKKVYP